MDQFLYHFARVLIASKLAPKNCIPYSIDSFLFLHPQPSPLIPPSCYVQITIIVFGQFSYSLFLLGNGPFCTVQCKSRKPWVLEANCQNIVPQNSWKNSTFFLTIAGKRTQKLQEFFSPISTNGTSSFFEYF